MLINKNWYSCYPTDVLVSTVVIKPKESSEQDVEDKLAAFESGAVDYMIKPFSMQELSARIKTLNAHINSQEQFEISVAQLSICVQTGTVQYDSQHIQMHNIGQKLLLALMRSHPKPLTTDRLCSIIWEDEIPKSNPLKAHISRINAQFNNHAQQKIITSIRGIGYQLTLSSPKQVSEDKADSDV